MVTRPMTRGVGGESDDQTSSLQQTRCTQPRRSTPYNQQTVGIMVYILHSHRRLY